MVKIQQHSNLTDLATFIAQLNSHTEHHIGYCGKKAGKILNTLEEEFSDIPAYKTFFVAKEDNNIVGVCGFDADIKRGNAEVWGPFVDHPDALHVSKKMWRSMFEVIPNSIHTILYSLTTTTKRW
ncbi:hypothetical protein [Thalassobacillus sp. CUG 92003]|uniref:hypothetical protein n=1 Tax=Thalassobacillus sp. CUG 92003 TaxID=2736641 RepID=UPI0015E6BB18|nr:hypothetical protein [Thalassobacillus sp. CUG 92003]